MEVQQGARSSGTKLAVPTCTADVGEFGVADAHDLQVVVGYVARDVARAQDVQVDVYHVAHESGDVAVGVDDGVDDGDEDDGDMSTSAINIINIATIWPGLCACTRTNTVIGIPRNIMRASNITHNICNVHLNIMHAARW